MEYAVIELIWNFFVITYDYLQEELRVRRAEFILSVAGHEIIS